MGRTPTYATGGTAAYRSEYPYTPNFSRQTEPEGNWTQRAKEQVGEKAKEIAGSVKDAAQSTGEKTMDAVRDAAGQVGDRIRSGAEQVAERAQRVVEEVRPELEQTAKKVVEDVKQVGKEAAHDLQDSAQKAPENWTTLKGRWNQIKGEAKRQWGKLTDDDLMRIEGDYDKLVGLIQQKYGFSRSQAEQEVNTFSRNRL